MGETEAGEWGRDEIRNIVATFNLPYRSPAPTGAVTWGSLDSNFSQGGTGSAVSLSTFDASTVVPTGPENVPPHVWQPVILYLGMPA